MSFNHDPEAKLNRYGGLLVENKRGQTDTGAPHSMMRKRLLEQFANNLAHDAVTITETRYTKEYRLEVYVLTTAQLEKYVQHRAERLFPSMPSVRWADE